MKAARDRRPAPFVDRTVYVSWNAMTAEAFLEAGAILGGVHFELTGDECGTDKNFARFGEIIRALRRTNLHHQPK